MAPHTPSSARAGCMEGTLCCWAQTIDSSMGSIDAACINGSCTDMACPAAMRPLSSEMCKNFRAEAAAGMQVLTPDNVTALRDSVLTLTKTLQHIEGITGDLGGFTGDARNKSNLKQLIEALSRIVSD